MGWRRERQLGAEQYGRIHDDPFHGRSLDPIEGLPMSVAGHRIGLAIRYIPTHLKQAVGAGDWAALVRGKDS